jgi:all-trans-retinol dehydrogenase (NAD+)
MNEALRMQLSKEGSAVRCTMVSPSYIDTGMFEGVRTRFSLLLPILKQEAVARRILTAVRRNAVELQMPPLVYTTDLMRGLFPAWAFDKVAGVLGISASLDNFVQTRDNQRAGAAEEAGAGAEATGAAKPPAERAVQRPKL